MTRILDWIEMNNLEDLNNLFCMYMWNDCSSMFKGNSNVTMMMWQINVNCSKTSGDETWQIQMNYLLSTYQTVK
jgi:hypothetical protein